MNTMIKSYSELIKFSTIQDRFIYLMLNGNVAEETFGSYRRLNQAFYRSAEWKHTRDQIILRDNGCELGLDGYDIVGTILVHHINPITIDDILHHTRKLFDPENLVCVSGILHEGIHYGNENFIDKLERDRNPIIRTKNDTCPWKTEV